MTDQPEASMAAPQPKSHVGDDKSQANSPGPNGYSAPPSSHSSTFSPPSHVTPADPQLNPCASSSPPCHTPVIPSRDLKPKTSQPKITSAAALQARQLAEMEQGLVDGRYTAAIRSAIARREEWKQLDNYEAQITRKQALEFVWIEQGENEVFRQQMDLADREKALEKKEAEYDAIRLEREEAKKLELEEKQNEETGSEDLCME